MEGAVAMAMARDLPRDSLTYLILAVVTHGCLGTQHHIPSITLISYRALLLCFFPVKASWGWKEQR